MTTCKCLKCSESFRRKSQKAGTCWNGWASWAGQPHALLYHPCCFGNPGALWTPEVTCPERWPWGPVGGPPGYGIVVSRACRPYNGSMAIAGSPVQWRWTYTSKVRQAPLRTLQLFLLKAANDARTATLDSPIDSPMMHVCIHEWIHGMPEFSAWSPDFKVSPHTFKYVHKKVSYCNPVLNGPANPHLHRAAIGNALPHRIEIWVETLDSSYCCPTLKPTQCISMSQHVCSLNNFIIITHVYNNHWSSFMIHEIVIEFSWRRPGRNHQHNCSARQFDLCYPPHAEMTNWCHVIHPIGLTQTGELEDIRSP